MNFKEFIAETLDPRWERIQDSLEDDVKNNPKLVKLAKFVCDHVMHDGEDSLKVIGRMSNGSREKALKITILDNLSDSAKREFSRDDIDYVFDCVLAAANGGTEYEWPEDR